MKLMIDDNFRTIATRAPFTTLFVILTLAAPAFSQDFRAMAPGLMPSMPEAGAEVPKSESHRIVAGQILKMEQDYFLLEDATGHALRLHMTETARGRETLRVGDWVKANATADGEVIIITKFNGRRIRPLDESSGGASGGERGFPFGR